MSGGCRMHKMADNKDNTKSQKRLILHECTEEFQASCQDFTLKRFILGLREFTSEELSLLWDSIHSLSEIQSALLWINRADGQHGGPGSPVYGPQSPFLHHKSSRISLVVHTHTWTSGNFPVFDSFATI